MEGCRGGREGNNDDGFLLLLAVLPHRHLLINNGEEKQPAGWSLLCTATAIYAAARSQLLAVCVACDTRQHARPRVGGGCLQSAPAKNLGELRRCHPHHQSPAGSHPTAPRLPPPRARLHHESVASSRGWTSCSHLPCLAWWPAALGELGAR
jgi:hypothetical protein